MVHWVDKVFSERFSIMESFEVGMLSLLNQTAGTSYHVSPSTASVLDFDDVSSTSLSATEFILSGDNITEQCENLTDPQEVETCYENYYLHLYLGPRRLPRETLIPVTIIYIIIFVTGVFGNLTTCIVILTNQYMQTATNYYLFNLAMADMTTLIVGE